MIAGCVVATGLLGFELLDGDDGPLEGFVEGFVGSVDGDGIGKELLVTLGVGLVGGSDAVVQFFERCAQGMRCWLRPDWCRRPSAADRGVPWSRVGIDVELQFDGMDLGALLVGSENAGSRAGNRDGRGESRGSRRAGRRSRSSPPWNGFFSVCEAANPLGPGMTPSLRMGHMNSRFGSEAEGEVGGMEAVELEEDHGTGAGGAAFGRKHDLANREGNVRIGDDGAVGVDFNLGGLLVDVDGNRVAFDVGLDGEVGEDLMGSTQASKVPSCWPRRTPCSPATVKGLSASV